MKVLKPLLKGDLLGLHYAVLLLLAAGFLCLTHQLGDATNPIWAVMAAVGVIDPQVKMACFPFRARVLNVFIGCVAGLGFLIIERPSAWVLPFALSAAALMLSYLVRVQLSWRIAPIVAAIVVASGSPDHSPAIDIAADFRRVIEVVLGSLVGLVVPWLMFKLWLPPDSNSGSEEATVCATGG